MEAVLTPAPPTSHRANLPCNSPSFCPPQAASAINTELDKLEAVLAPATPAPHSPAAPARPGSQASTARGGTPGTVGDNSILWWLRMPLGAVVASYTVGAVSGFTTRKAGKGRTGCACHKKYFREWNGVQCTTKGEFKKENG
eukprot:1160256-Pelagomonas_calceolata.AAC.12